MYDMNLRVVPRSGIGEPRNSEGVDDIEHRDRNLDIPSLTENRETQGSKTIKDHAVAEHPRESSSESADQVVVNYTAVAPDQRLRRSRVLHSSVTSL